MKIPITEATIEAVNAEGLIL